MAASNTSARDRTPYLAWAAIQPSTSPGTETGEDALVGDAVLAVPVDVGGVGGSARGVADLDGVGLAVVDHDEAVAANAGHVGLDDVEGGGGGDGGVDGVAAPLECGHAGLGGEGMPGADHAVAAHDDGAVGLEVDAVGGVRHGGCLLRVGCCYVGLCGGNALIVGWLANDLCQFGIAVEMTQPQNLPLKRNRILLDDLNVYWLGAGVREHKWIPGIYLCSR